MPEPSDRSSPVLAVGSMTFLGAVGLLVGIVTGSLTFSLVGGPLSIPSTAPSGQLVFNFGTYAGLTAVGVVYLLRHDLSVSYVNFEMPTVRDLLWIVATVVVLVAFSTLVSALVTRLGIPFTDHSIADSIEMNPVIALVFLPLSILVVGPAEEFLYRGIIQTRLRELFDAGLAIAAASLIFAVVHFPAYIDPANISGTVVTVFVILLPLGAILGVAYERTKNLAVPALAHGCYNAVTYGLIYADVVGL